VYNFIMKNLLLALITALSFSSFIYFEEFNLTNYFINSILAILSIYMLLTIPKKAILFMEIFWLMIGCWSLEDTIKTMTIL